MGALAANIYIQQLPLLPLQGAAYRNQHAWLVSSDRPHQCLVICCPAAAAAASAAAASAAAAAAAQAPRTVEDVDVHILHGNIGC
jgi:hypothetical protein